MENQFNDYGLFGHKKLEIFKNTIIPQHIRMNYPNFVTFIEIYLKKITQEHEGTEFIHNMLAYANIDETSAFFVEEFCKNYLKDLLYLPEINKRTLVKWVRQWYEATGSQQSFKFLFRVLYNEDVDFYFPSVDIFRVSDGKWAKEYIIRVHVSEEDIDKFNEDMVGTEIIGTETNSRALFENFMIHETTQEEILNKNVATYMQKFVDKDDDGGFQETPPDQIEKRVFYTVDIYVTDFDTQRSIENLLANEKIEFTYLTNPEKKVYAPVTYIISSIVIKDGSPKGIFYRTGDEIKIDHPFGEGAKCVVERVSSGYFYGLQIVNGGEGYEVNDRIGLNDGHGLGFYAYVSKVDENGTIEAVTIGNTGENYLYFPDVSIETINGSGARLIPLTDTVGAIESIKILEPGHGYREVEDKDISVCFYKTFSINGCSNIARYDQNYNGRITTSVSDKEGYGPGICYDYASSIGTKPPAYIDINDVANNLMQSYKTYTVDLQHHPNYAFDGDPSPEDNIIITEKNIDISAATDIMNYELNMPSGLINCCVPTATGLDYTNPGRTDFVNTIVVNSNPSDDINGTVTTNYYNPNKDGQGNKKDFDNAAKLLWKHDGYGPQAVTLGLRQGEKDYASLNDSEKASMKSILNIRKPYSFPLQFEKIAIRPSAISNVLVQFYIDENIRKYNGKHEDYSAVTYNPAHSKYNDLRLGEIVYAEVDFMKYKDIMETKITIDEFPGLNGYDLLHESTTINDLFQDWIAHHTHLSTLSEEDRIIELYSNYDTYIDEFLSTYGNDKEKYRKLLDFWDSHLQQTVLRYPYGRITRINNDMGYMLIDKYEGYEFMAGMELRGTVSESRGNIIISANTVKFDYEVGPLFKIPSYYKNTDGHIGSKKKIQDSYFYQCYSYVLKSNIKKDQWEEPVNEAVHPSGLIVFGVGEVHQNYGISYGGERIDIDPRSDEITWNLESLQTIAVKDNNILP